MRYYRLLALAWFLLAVPAARAADDSGAENGVKQALKKAEEAFNRHDAAALAETFTEGGTITPMGRELNGRGEIRKFYEEAFRGELKDVRLRFALRGCHMVRPDVAVCDGDESAEGGGDKTPFVLVVVREGDRWQVAAVRFTLPLDQQNPKPAEPRPSK